MIKRSTVKVTPKKRVAKKGGFTGVKGQLPKPKPMKAPSGGRKWTAQKRKPKTGFR
jgi:hypothetical protein